MTADLPREIYATMRDGQPIWWIGGMDSPGVQKYIRADLAEKPVDTEIMEAVEWIQKYYLNEPHGDHNPFPAYIETLIRAASRAKELEKYDAAVDKVLNMTDEQIRVLCMETGECPECVGSKTSAVIMQTLINHYKKENAALRAATKNMGEKE